jgi:hypothetical protein
MAITLSQTASAWKTPAASPQTMSFTTVSGDTELVVFIRAYDGDRLSAAPTFNGTSMAAAATKQKEGAASDYWYCYRLVSPAITTANISCSFSPTARAQILAFSLQGTSGGATEDNDGNNGTAATASLINTSLTNGAWHIVGLTADQAITPTLNWTSIVTENSNGFCAVGYYNAATAGIATQTATFSLSQFAISGFVTAPAGGGGGGTPSRLMMLGVG